MADEKITELPVATVVNPSDVLPIVQSGTTKQAAASLIGGAPGGADGELQYNDNGALDGTAGLTWHEEEDRYLEFRAIEGQTDAQFRLLDSNGRFGVEAIATDETSSAGLASNINLNDFNGALRIQLSVESNILSFLKILYPGSLQFKGDGTVISSLGANNLTGILIQRKTNTSPTGNFLSFISATGAQLFAVDINGILNLTPTTEPGTPAEGMVYAGTDHHLYYYNGSTWKQLDN